jgi:hypothetical protein
MEVTEAPRLLYRFSVHRRDGDVERILGDRCYVEEGILQIFRDDTMVAAFMPDRWVELTSDPCLLEKKVPGRRCRKPEYEADYCDE